MLSKIRIRSLRVAGMLIILSDGSSEETSSGQLKYEEIKSSLSFILYIFLQALLRLHLREEYDIPD